jgi:hypothetical protein
VTCGKLNAFSPWASCGQMWRLVFAVLQSILGAFAKWRKATVRFMSFRPSPHGTTRLPVDRFSRNLIFEDFYKICRENSSLIKIWQKYRLLYMKTYVHLWYIAELCEEWEMFQTKVVEIIKTHITLMSSNVLTVVLFERKCGKIWQSHTGHRWQYNTAHALCMLDN